MFANLEEQEKELLWIEPEPDENAEKHKVWLWTSMKARRSMILSISVG